MIGESLADWVAPDRPDRARIVGHHCVLEALDARAHAQGLFAAYARDSSGANWTYLPYGPFVDEDAFYGWLAEQAAGTDPAFVAVIDPLSGSAVGVASFLRINPDMGSVEIGHIHFSPELQNTAAATEALYLMIRQVFSLGYRRCEWKCNALNAASRKAAQRLGLTFEGIFRQAAVIKGRNRDTAWYSIIDKEWPALNQTFERWLAPDNFSSAGVQKLRLSQLTARYTAQQT